MLGTARKTSDISGHILDQQFLEVATVLPVTVAVEVMKDRILLSHINNKGIQQSYMTITNYRIGSITTYLTNIPPFIYLVRQNKIEAHTRSSRV